MIKINEFLRNHMNELRCNIFSFTFLFLIMVAAFFSNFINLDRKSSLERIWSSEGSEALVVGKVRAIDMNMDTGKYGLGRLVKPENLQEESEYEYQQYISSFGAQGHFFSFLFNSLGIRKYNLFRILVVGLLSLVLVSICFLAKEQFGFAYSTVLYLGFLFSPWLTAYAKNLFWLPFTWFTPMLFSLMILRWPEKTKIFLALIFLSVYIKALCGYEFITTIMLSGISFFVISFFMEKDKVFRVSMIRNILLVGVVSLAAFSLALITHASIRGDSLSQGLISIYERDVLRRTFGGNAADFDPRYQTSIQASSLDVLNIYIFKWEKDVLFGINGRKVFPFLFFSSLIISFYYLFKKELTKIPMIFMFGMFFLASASWYVLGKSHSHIHVAFNYVLWYFGFIQFTIFALIKFIKDHFPHQPKIIKEFIDSL